MNHYNDSNGQQEWCFENEEISSMYPSMMQHSPHLTTSISHMSPMPPPMQLMQPSNSAAGSPQLLASSLQTHQSAAPVTMTRRVSTQPNSRSSSQVRLNPAGAHRVPVSVLDQVAKLVDRVGQLEVRFGQRDPGAEKQSNDVSRHDRDLKLLLAYVCAVCKVLGIKQSASGEPIFDEGQIDDGMVQSPSIYDVTIG